MKKSLLLFVFILFTISSLMASDIVINEIMYNSAGSDVEFIELYNNTDTAINLTGWTLIDDNNTHTPCELSGTIDANGYFVIAGNRTAFQTKYPGVSPLNPTDYDTGNDAWSFGNGGDVVNLYTATSTLHDQVEYNDGGDWPSSPDGKGPSLELLHPSLDNSLPTSWDPSEEDDGTPGAKNSVYTNNVMPTCRDGERNVDLPSASDAVTVTAIAFDNEGLAKVELMVNTGGGYVPLTMNDAGNDGDEAAGDSVYTGVIPPQSNGTLVKYYVLATDDIGQTDSWPNKAPDEYHAYTVGYEPPNIRVNEVLAINSSVNSDEAGEFDDWFELYNAGSTSVNLGGMYVSSSLGSSQMFELPDHVLGAGEYLLIWADNDESQGDFHTNFKLSGDGESVALFETIDHGNVLVHGWKYGRMSDNVSMGYKPINGTAPEYLRNPTPGATNETSTLFSDVCINEFQSTSDFGGPNDDWVEIYNRGETAYDLSGCFLSDERGNNDKWTFPTGNQSVLEPGHYLVIYEDELKFGFASEGDDVIMLTAPDTTTGLDFYDFDAQIADHSEGRYPDGVGIWQRFDKVSRGEANVGNSAVKEPVITPESITLYQNYPNPFNPTTTLTFSLSARAKVTIRIYNAIGQEVALLAKRTYQSGTYHILWNAESLPSGFYWVEMNTGSEKQMRKMVLLK